MRKNIIASVIRRHRNVVAVFVAAVTAVVGIITITGSQAATPVVVAEPESATIAAPAVSVNDTTASNTKAVKFQATTPTTPPPTTPGSCPNAQHTPGGSDGLGGCWPYDGNTGVLAGVTRTTYTGPTTITTNGTVIQNVNINSDMYIQANNVTLKNVKLTSNGYWPLRWQGSGGQIIDSTLIGGNNSQCSLSGGGWVGTRLNISGAGDGIKMGSNATLIDSYIHGLATFEGAHNDGIELTNATNSSVIHSTIFNQNGQTSAVMLSEYGSSADTNTLIQNNLLAGGGYTVYGGAPDTAKGHVVTGNVFSKVFFARSGALGPLNYWSANGNTWTNNKWADGTALNP